MSNTTIIIPKGTRVCLSERGHNNFYYPLAHKQIILAHDVEAEQLPWVGGGNLIAYKLLGLGNIIWSTQRYV